MFCHGWQNKASQAMEGLLNAVHVTLRNSNSGILSFSYFRTTEQNRHSFVQFDSQKIEKHLLTLESYKVKDCGTFSYRSLRDLFFDFNLYGCFFAASICSFCRNRNCLSNSGFLCCSNTFTVYRCIFRIRRYPLDLFIGFASVCFHSCIHRDLLTGFYRFRLCL